MYFEFNRYSALLFVFFLHGLVYSILLLRKGMVNESRSDKWLAAFLLLCVLYITPWMVGFGGWYDTQPFRDLLFYIPFQHLFWMGPVIFFYVQSLLNPSFRFRKKDVWHLLPGLLYFVFSVVMVITDKLVLKKYFFLANGEDPDFDTWYQLAGFISMLVYFIFSLRYYNLYRRMIVQVVSYAELVLFKWVRNFLLAFLSMLILRLLFFIATLIPAFHQLSYVGPWWEFLFFAVIFYYIAINGYSNSVETKVSFRLNLLTYKTPQLLQYHGPFVNDQEEITEAEVVELDNDNAKAEQNEEQDLSEWKNRLLQQMKDKKMYEDPELSLTQLSRALETNPSFISMLINKGFGVNFNDFVNQFRIEAIKEMMAKGEHKRQTLLGIAYECGFNSKATFNRAFKKITGQSPKEWLQKNTGTVGSTLS
ncbi:MAG: AraC family transcriptional regulator [Bacteroidetes bacterium]|nr:AraC family transcriptional regulator [Bacteroidota bacterium]